LQRSVCYSAILIPVERRTHSKRFHQQYKIAALVVENLFWIIGLHAFSDRNIKLRSLIELMLFIALKKIKLIADDCKLMAGK
jgi:hypothetical protein